MNEKPLPLPLRSMRSRLGNRTRRLLIAVRTPLDVDDVRLALKREIYLRELTIAQVAQRLPVTESYLQNLLTACVDKQRRITPGLLEQLIAAVHITPRVAARLRVLGARADGWMVEVPRAR